MSEAATNRKVVIFFVAILPQYFSGTSFRRLLIRTYNHRRLSFASRAISQEVNGCAAHSSRLLPTDTPNEPR
jgi:hypothetical protein